MGVTLNVESVACRPRAGVKVMRIEGSRKSVPTLLVWNKTDANPIVRRFQDTVFKQVGTA